MADWHLVFHHPVSMTLATCEQVLDSVVDAPVAVQIGELDGNPRDFYARPITMTGRRGDVLVGFTTSQSMLDARDPAPIITHANVTLSSETATFAARLATWRALRTAFAAAGARDRTPLSAAPIVDEADAAGEAATAMELRREISAALIEQAAVSASVTITSPRVDVAPILAAYQRAASISSVGLYDCGLQRLPESFSRFPNIEGLWLHEDALDASALRGLSLPKLTQLTVRSKALRRVTKDELAGFPSLEVLRLSDSPLESLDPAIIDVCPKLIRVYVENTPLEKDDAAMAELRARWPRMLWRYQDGYVQPPRPLAIKAPARPLPPARRAAATRGATRPQRPSIEQGVLRLITPQSIEEVSALLASGEYRGAVKLVVAHTTIGDAVARLVATSRAFPALVELYLGESGLTNAGVRALARKAVGLDALSEIDLGAAPGGREPGGISDTAARELALSPRLPALTRITRSIEHHVYAEGAREGTDEVEVRRDDGRVVRSVIDHFVWP